MPPKKIIASTNSKKPTTSKKNKKEEPPKAQQPTLGSLADIEPSIPVPVPATSEEPLDLNDEKSFLSQLNRTNDLKTMKNILNKYANNFDKKGLVKTFLEKFNTVEKLKYVIHLFFKQRSSLNFEQFYDKFLKEPDDRLLFKEILGEENFENFKRDFSGLIYIFPEYETAIKNTAVSYNDKIILKYIINLYLLQYSLTFQDFYDKFLQQPRNFLELREFRKLLYSISENNTDFETVKKDLRAFGVAYPDYNEAITSMLEELDEKFLNKFIKDFLKQSSEGVERFYKIFVSDPLIKLNLGNAQKIDIAEEQTPIVLKYEHGFGFVDEPSQRIPDFTEPVRSKVEKKKAPYKISTGVSECEFIFTTVPWIQEKVLGIYIARVDTDISKYIQKDKSLDINDELYYKVNKNYYELRCEKTLFKTQKDDILNFSKKGELLVNFKIAFEVETANAGVIGVYLQDEDMFKDEVKYMKEKSKTSLQVIEEILTEPVGDDAKTIAFSIMKNYFDKSADKNYINQIIDLAVESSPTVKDLAKQLANIAIYLSQGGIEKINFGAFRTHIEIGYYKPEDLLKLSYKEKAPEIFGPDNQIDRKTRDQIKSDLKRNFNDFIEDFADNMYISRNIYTRYKPRKDTRHGNRFMYNLTKPLRDWRKNCTNFKPKNLENTLQNMTETIKNNREIADFLKKINSRSPILEDVEYIKNIIEEKSLGVEYDTLLRDIQEDMKDLPDSLVNNIEYIDEKGDTYSIEFYDLQKIIRQKKKYNNPHTNKALSTNFVNKIKPILNLHTKISQLTNKIILKLLRERQDLEKRYNMLINESEQQLQRIPLNSLGYYLKYKEKGETYCLNSDEIIEQIDNNILLNPYTGNELSPEFVEKVKSLYKLKRNTLAAHTQKESEITPTAQVSLAPGLLNYIRLDIDRMLELKKISSTLERYDGCQCKKNYEDGDSVYGDEEDDEDILYVNRNFSYNKKDEEEDGRMEPEIEENVQVPEQILEEENNDEDYGVLLDQAQENDDIDIFSQDEEEDNNSIQSQTDRLCENCKSSIDGRGFKSFKWNCDTKEADHVVFCSIKCIEDFNWKKYKYTKRKSRKNKDGITISNTDNS